MAGLRLEISMSLDGFVAGPEQTLEEPLGRGGEQLHEWIFGLASWREAHGLESGERNADDDVVRETAGKAGAIIMGRKMFSSGSGPWEADPKADGWWGGDPPFRAPVFVLTHHPRETVTKPNGTSFVFVTDGIESALSQARAAAGNRGVDLAGGADVAQQYLRAGLVDEIELHVVPMLLGGGVRLFDGVGDVKLELTRAESSPAVTHLWYRVLR
jgi:dihydrofolate reductase